jgi:hypothetical protein
MLLPDEYDVSDERRNNGMCMKQEMTLQKKNQVTETGADHNKTRMFLLDPTQQTKI